PFRLNPAWSAHDTQLRHGVSATDQHLERKAGCDKAATTIRYADESHGGRMNLDRDNFKLRPAGGWRLRKNRNRNDCDSEDDKHERFHVSSYGRHRSRIVR